VGIPNLSQFFQQAMTGMPGAASKSNIQPNGPGGHSGKRQSAFSPSRLRRRIWQRTTTPDVAFVPLVDPEDFVNLLDLEISWISM
jgi:hypothetical protein